MRRGARGARSDRLKRAEPAADENLNSQFKNSAGVLILSFLNERHQNNHLETFVGRRTRGTTNGSDAGATRLDRDAISNLPRGFV